MYKQSSAERSEVIFGGLWMIRTAKKPDGTANALMVCATLLGRLLAVGLIAISFVMMLFPELGRGSGDTSQSKRQDFVAQSAIPEHVLIPKPIDRNDP